MEKGTQAMLDAAWRDARLIPERTKFRIKAAPGNSDDAAINTGVTVVRAQTDPDHDDSMSVYVLPVNLETWTGFLSASNYGCYVDADDLEPLP